MITSALFGELVDDAGLFPPEELSMSDALTRHREQRNNPIVTGRFLCPAPQLTRCLAHLNDGEPLDLGLICSLQPDALLSTLSAVATEPLLRLRSVEGVLPGDRVGLQGTGLGVPVYVELACGPALEADLDWVAAQGLRAKLRCGGVRRELFPTATQVAAFVHACTERRVPFKATAGLHNALAHRDPRTGFDHHGFVNLTLAAARASDGASVPDLVAALDVREADALVAEAQRMTEPQVKRTRESFICYGSCSITEPLADLVSLGLLTDTGNGNRHNDVA